MGNGKGRRALRRRARGLVAGPGSCARPEAGGEPP